MLERRVTRWALSVAVVPLVAAACTSTSTPRPGSRPQPAAPAASSGQPGHAGASSPGAGLPRAETSATPAGPIGHAGRWLTDAGGRVLLLHGVNMVDKQPPYDPAAEGFSAADASWLAANGFRVVRLGVLASGMMPTPGVVNRSYLDHIGSTVHMLGAHGIFTLLDFHQDCYGTATGGFDGFPAWMTVTGGAKSSGANFPLCYVANPAVEQAFQSFWDDAPAGGTSLVGAYAEMFGALAARVAHDPYVLGYDLFNEPWPGTTWKPCVAGPDGCPSLEKSELAPAYATAVKAIRAAGDHHLVFGEPFVLFNFGTAPTHLPLPGGDAASGMSFHMYPLAPSKETAVLANAISWSQATSGALVDSEWGGTTNGADDARQVRELDTALLPWIFWSFNGSMVKSVARPPTGSNIVASSVDALVGPSPLAVAGTPLSESRHLSPSRAAGLDRRTATLSFTWSTARAGGSGARFPAGAVTSFEVPARAFPGGYKVSAEGGRVTSPIGAPVLTVVADGGARTVSIVIASPAGA